MDSKKDETKKADNARQNSFGDRKLLRNRITGFFIVAASILGILGIYYYKYLPVRQNEFNRSAFRELSQMQKALQVKNAGYLDAIRNYVKSLNRHGSLYSSNSLFAEMAGYFAENGFEPLINEAADSIKVGTDFSIEQLITSRYELFQRWKLSYVVSKTDRAHSISFSKNLDSLFDQVVTNYKDIFNDFIVIKCEQQKDNQKNGSGTSQNQTTVSAPDDTPTETNAGQVIYNSGSLSIDYLVRTDSLLKNGNAFNQLNIRNSTIEGNAYKLFLFPFRLGTQRLILVGIISLENYNAGYRIIPLKYAALIAGLLLLFIIYLPVLKLFKMSEFERTTSGDIRLLIASYFIGVFLIFFIAVKFFIDNYQKESNHRNLSYLSQQINSRFRNETSAICQQIRSFDSVIDKIGMADSLVLLNGLWKPKSASPLSDSQQAKLDRYFLPQYYRFTDNIFWIDNTGFSKARYSFRKKQNASSPGFDVSDRQYFMDFFQKKFLVTDSHGGLEKDTFTIQPTLDKLDGEYTINVVMQSHRFNDAVWERAGFPVDSVPAYIGLSAKMRSVYNTILSPGFNFSIIDNGGNILYDSKSGRALLSNLFDAVEDPGTLAEAVKNRSSMFQDHIILRGREVSLLSYPIKDFPYSVVVYYKDLGSDSYEEHLLALTAFSSLFSLILVLLSGSINWWFRKRRNLLIGHGQKYDWLHPLRAKSSYYRQLCWGFIILFLIYLLAWLVETIAYPVCDYASFFITLLFPFYIALFYFKARAAYFNKAYASKPENKVPTPSHYFATYTYLAIAITALNFMFLFNKLAISFWEIFFILSIQALFTGVAYRFSRVIGLSPEEGSDQLFLKRYVRVALLSVYLISVVPAAGIFCLIFRQEKNLDLNSIELNLASQIHQRALDLNKKVSNLKYGANAAFRHSDLQDLKFNLGIYTLGGDSVIYNADTTRIIDESSVVQEYWYLHKQLFSEDPFSLSGDDGQRVASDSSWYFKPYAKNEYNPRLLYKPIRDAYSPEAIGLRGRTDSPDRPIYLLLSSIAGLSDQPIIYLLFIAVLALCLLYLGYQLSKSIARRSFVLDLKQVYLLSPGQPASNDFVGEAGLAFSRVASFYSGSKDMQDKLHLETPLTIDSIYNFEVRAIVSGRDEVVYHLSELLKYVYKILWEDLSDEEKFVLYDFAEDGFTNYKADRILLSLLRKRTLRYDDERLRIITPSFREYILGMAADHSVIMNMDKARKLDYWSMIRVPLLLILTTIGIFIFVTQEETYQKITGLLTTIGTLVPLISSMFNKEGRKEGS